LIFNSAYAASPKSHGRPVRHEIPDAMDAKSSLHGLPAMALPCWLVIHLWPKRSTMSITAINVRNQFRGKVKEIIEGPVVSEIDVETPSGLVVTSVITTRSVKELGLVPGKEVIALVKSTEVAIAAL
jgi:molybdopterin-binding protein